ncbi:MAG: phosphoribosylglycinamide synthetase C domain-containing protein, partial [Streptomycetales bacterium]
RPGAAVTVVVAAAGYPGQPRTGDRVLGLDEAEAIEGVAVLHAGTRLDDRNRVVSSGGRVLSVTATGPTLSDARARAYAGVDRIRLEGSQHRRDIALAAVEDRVTVPG